jgi:heat shock protein HtpX
MVVLAYSRRREYAADRGSSNYVGTHKMIAALEKLRKIHEDNAHVTQPASLAALKIDGKSRGFLHLFASHPPIEARIEKLKQN